MLASTTFLRLRGTRYIHSMDDAVRVRPMTRDDAPKVVSYFRGLSRAALDDMGVDPAKLPRKRAWIELIQRDMNAPDAEREFFYLGWEAQGTLIGHTNINQIRFGKSAFMHLHLWEPSRRTQGLGTELVRQSVPIFVERFGLRLLICEPKADNPGPNRLLPKVGFKLVRSYRTSPGWIGYEQIVNRWEFLPESIPV